MRFVLLQEIDAPGGDVPPPSRYHETVIEARFAEKMGWHCVALSEQHFNKSVSTNSAPESFLGYMAAVTQTIRLRIASVVALPFNNPIRSVEQIATLDVLSNGRLDIGVARSNNPTTLKTFGVKASDTRAMSQEWLDAAVAAMTQYPFEYHGKFWDFPPTTVNPRTIQKPHPPIHISAASAETHFTAGLRGIGVMTGNSLAGGWKYIEDSIAEYRRGQKEQTPATLIPGSKPFSCAGVLGLVAHCAETNEQAFAESDEMARRTLQTVAGWFKGLASQTTDYAALGTLREVTDRLDDLPFLNQHAPYVSVGDPAFFIERCHRLKALGYDEFLLRIDGMGHERHMKAIELIGKHVIPAVS